VIAWVVVPLGRLGSWWGRGGCWSGLRDGVPDPRPGTQNAGAKGDCGRLRVIQSGRRKGQRHLVFSGMASRSPVGLLKKVSKDSFSAMGSLGADKKPLAAGRSAAQKRSRQINGGPGCQWMAQMAQRSIRRQHLDAVIDCKYWTLRYE
jgi:hypothetical protein